MKKHAWLLGLLLLGATALPVLAEPASDFNALGVSFTRFGMLEEAVNEFKKAVKQDPFFATGYYNLGVAYGKLRQYDKAVEAFKKTLELNPLNYHPLRNDRRIAVSAAELLKFIAACGHEPQIVALPEAA